MIVSPAALQQRRLLRATSSSPDRTNKLTSYPSRFLATAARKTTRSTQPSAGPSTGTVVSVTIAALAVSALVDHLLARKAERDNPPAGRFLTIDGVRLHYVERGSAEALVLLHGNGSMIQDFASSGLTDLAAKKYRVIVFDRPGYGHSDRPRTTLWTPEAQADLIHATLAPRTAWPTSRLSRPGCTATFRKAASPVCQVRAT